MPIRAVLFDFGGVLTSSPFEAFAAFEVRCGLPPGFIRSVNATNADDNAWARLERSEIGIDEFDEEFRQEAVRLGHEVGGDEVLALLAGELRPEMVRAVRRCANSHVLGLLTNNFVSVDALPRFGVGSEVAGVIDLFDAVVESSRVGVRKPDEAFYRIACDELGIAPDEAVFLDDLGINLKPARAMGMTTIKVEDPGVALRQLEEVLGIDLTMGA